MSFDFKQAGNIWGVKLGCFVLDSAVMAGAYLMAFLLRFDFQEPWWGWHQVAYSFITVFLVQWFALGAFGCYRLLWRYLSISDVPRFVGAIGTSTGVMLMLRVGFPDHQYLRPPYGVTFFNSFLACGGLLSLRLLWRVWVDREISMWSQVNRERRRSVLLVGAGTAGNLVARELHRNNRGRYAIVGFLDDDAVKIGAKIQGHAVLGTLDELPAVVRRHAVDEVIICMAKASREVIRRVIRLCEASRVPARIVPAYSELIHGKLTASNIREVDVSDLLGREELTLDNQAVVKLLNEKCILVTGAGGTIGGELARQIMLTGPAKLVLVERSENALYETERRLRCLGSATNLATVLADVGDALRMREIFADYQPHVVLHAAAHKHVPLMEQNPGEAIRNNVLASRQLGEIAIEHHVERLVLISTDKAVKPTSVMGISKRLTEIALQDLNRHGQTRFSAVRFGNVLDSSGSVVPLFREQIRQGESVTVTHPEMKRYFMTIGEAVALVLQASALARGGEIFVLDMGEPVRILELAEEMIALSGLRPYEDIPIVFTGIRPGEKLFEELDVSEKSTFKTGHARIFISKGGDLQAQAVQDMLDNCRALVVKGASVEHLREQLKTLAATLGLQVADHA